MIKTQTYQGDELTSKSPIEKAIETNTNLITKIKERMSKTNSTVEEDKPKSKMKTWPVTKLKVACIIGVITLSAVLYSYLSIPSVYDAIIALFRDLFPSVTGTASMEYFVD